MLLDTSIRFPNLGIEIGQLGTGISLFGIEIAYYGIIIACGMLAGFYLVEWQAKRTGQQKELYLDFAIYAIIASIVGARLYYVIFSFDEFKDDLLSILNLRTGGLAIYGGIIAGVLAGIIFTKVKKVSFALLADTCSVGLLLGQILGRWGNFFNREAFGGYSDGLLAMQINKAEVASSNITQELLDHVVRIKGIEYIQVHPTFLYESLWNLILLILILLYTKHKKFDGELFIFYVIGYGVGRTWIESLRTDQLLLWGTNLAVSELLSITIVIVAIGIWIAKRTKIGKNKENKNRQ
ncbi:prolipoprotein diacylglyceryl transferase [Anaerosporobacter faecicola]|uniref:prolipoprotein diacylglyceryl transferase n=1 Tax=Anaerosporobacter faecicola TaxID=2718714 RepID=UPI00143979B5|nr:prolipoprotein diacylglyceryl transferase [Anaerosporobacter faecicola]